MSKSKRTPEEEIQHLKKKLRKLEAETPTTSISITGQYRDRDRDSGAKRPNVLTRDSDDEEGLILSPEHTPVRNEPSAAKEPKPTPPISQVLANVHAMAALHSRSEPRANADAMEAQSSTSTPMRPRVSCDTRVTNNSNRKPRTSSETSHNSDNNIGSDRHEQLLKALGDDLSLSGEVIHPSLAQKWPAILRKGLPLDIKEKLLKEYAAPENCKLLKAPILNEEISSVIEYHAKNRDKILEQNQNQLGMGITAIGRAITVLLNQGENYEVNAMKHFNHGCRILLDLHNVQTYSRRHLFKNDLMRSEVFRNLRIQDLERDDTLFSNKIGKMVKKQGIVAIPPHLRASASGYDLRNDTNLGRDGEHSRYRRN